MMLTTISGPNGHSVPAQVVHQTPDGVFKAEFVPRNVGEHRVSVSVKSIPTAGSPYSAKVSSC
jgi:Filamin/ABP280 repeat